MVVARHHSMVLQEMETGLEDWLRRVVTEADGDLTGLKVMVHNPSRSLCCLEMVMIQGKQEESSYSLRCCLGAVMKND